MPMNLKLRDLLGAIRSILSMAAIVAFIWWLTRGSTHASLFWWILLAVILTPIVLYVLFLAAIVISALRRARRKP